MIGGTECLRFHNYDKSRLKLTLMMVVAFVPTRTVSMKFDNVLWSTELRHKLLKNGHITGMPADFLLPAVIAGSYNHFW